jgi:sulfonate transport system ATP-binding protein
MAPRPGRIKRIVDVALPRPRDRGDARFIRLRDEIVAEFGEPGTSPRDSGGNLPHTAPAHPPITEWRLAW